MGSTVLENQPLPNLIVTYKSSDPLRNIQCHCDERTVTLTGFVSRFYHLQLAIEAGRKLAEGRKLDVQIEVVASPEDVHQVSAGETD